MLALQLGCAVILTLFCSAMPWAFHRANRTVIGVVLAVLVAFAAVGIVVGLALYPLSNLVVIGIAVAGGILVGRALPPRFRPFLTLLLVLSLLDVAQAAAFSGPPPGPTSGGNSAPNPHLIWVNVRVPLPSGHFNIGFADLLLITAMAEYFRRRQDSYPIALIPGIVGLSLVYAVGAAPGSGQLLGGALTQALIPYLTLGWLLAFWLSSRGFGTRLSISAGRYSSSK